MKALYLIHILILTEIVAAILIALKLNDLAKKIKVFKDKIKVKALPKIEKVQKLRDFCQKFNYKYEHKVQISLDFAAKIIKDVVVRSLIGKFIISKSRFVPKMFKTANVIFWFVLTFLFIKNRNA